MKSLLTYIIGKSIAKDIGKMALKHSKDNKVVSDKLGVNSIDEFMKLSKEELFRKRET